MSEHCRRNKKLFWKGINGVRKKKKAMEANVKDRNGAILVVSEEPTVFRYKVASSLSRLLDPRLD